MADNTVTVIGNITRDPELRFTNAGQAIATIGLAVNRRFQRNGQWEENTSFFNVTCWGQLGENVSASLGKGTRVIVTGRLEQRSWETQDGDKRSVVEIVADEVAPSLRWATVEVTKNERKEGGDFAGGGGNSGGGAPRSVANEPMSGGSNDEEPF